MGTPDSCMHIVDDSDIYVLMHKGYTVCTVDNSFSEFTLTNKLYKLNNLAGVGKPVSHISRLNEFRTIIDSEKDGSKTYSLFTTNSLNDMSPIWFKVRKES